MSMRDSGVGAVGDGLGGPVALAILVGVGWVVWSLFALSIALAVGAIAFVVVCFVMIADMEPIESGEKIAATVCLVLAALATVLIYPLTIEFHVVPFAIAGWTAAGLFLAAVIVAWIAFSIVGRVLGMIAGSTAVAAMLILPAPNGAADPADKESEWKITLTVLDERDEPLKSAVAQCSAAMIWEGEGPVTFSHLVAQTTSEEGEATFTFHEDPRLKTAVCTALKEGARDDDGPIHMAPREEHFARAHYPPKSVTMASPLPGGDYKLTVKLEPRQESGTTLQQ